MMSRKIITKPPNRGFQVRQPSKITAEQEKALRDQLHMEIENKTKACSNLTYDCSLPRLDGYEFCNRHILQDSKAPYKQCVFLYSVSGRRCLQPAPKHETKKDAGLTNYCFEHSRLAQITKSKSGVSKYKETESTESFLNSLSHHIKIDKLSKANEIDQFEREDLSNLNVDPFVDIDSISMNDKGKQILDYESDSSTDEDIVTVSNSWKGHDLDMSDVESVDSQNEDLLKHAEIYTTEEATMITKEKLIRLQALYIEQFQRLQHVLKERRRKYLHGLRREKETYCSISNQNKDTPKERRLYEKLKALNKYHKHNGVQAILHKQYIEKRAKVTIGLGNKIRFHSKCMFSEGGVKCGEKILPCCKYCKKHILEDKKQILFRACGVEKSGVICQEPVANIFDSSTCYLHIQSPSTRNYTQKKYESETDEEDLIMNEMESIHSQTEDIKPIYSDIKPNELKHSPQTNQSDISPINTPTCDNLEKIESKTKVEDEIVNSEQVKKEQTSDVNPSTENPNNNDNFKVILTTTT